MQKNTVKQMELGLNSQSRPVMRRTKRLAGAQWWFAQMRAAVDRATGWQTSPAGGPAQVHLALATQEH